jgi:hypothetical protein
MLPTVREITVDVTAEDIASGKRGSRWECPFVLAVKRVLETEGVESGNYFMFIGDPISDAPRLVVDLPDEVSEFIMSFDRKGFMGVSPRSFVVNLVSAPPVSE